MPTAALTQLTFREAANAWLESRKPYLSTKTIHEYLLNIKTLSLFFGQMRLPEITADQIRAYQRGRLTQCGPFSINHECSVLQQMLKRIGHWNGIASDYQPLPLPKEKRGRALLDAERNRFFRVAASNPNWEAAFLFGLIAVNTTIGPKETATLRLKDIDLVIRTVSVQPEGAKNLHRIRTIPLNEQAFEAANAAVERAKRLGSTQPEHYVFPFRIHRSLFDPTRHQTTFKTAWRKMVLAAGLPLNFRMYDLRHTAITALLENPQVSDETAEAIAGHISWEMKKRYSHVRMEAKRRAVQLLTPASAKKKPQRATSRELDGEDILRALAKLLKAQ